MGYLVRHDDVTGRNRNIASRIWFRLRNAKHANAFMPPGKYAVAYASGDYGRTDYIYSSLLRFIEKNGCSVTGDSYEEYLLDEMTTADPEKYLLQIAVRVGCPE